MGCARTLLILVCSVVLVSGLLAEPKTKNRHNLARTLDKTGMLKQLPLSVREKVIEEHRNREHKVDIDKRDSSSCALDNRELESSGVELKETAESIQAVWIGKDIILILASQRSDTGRTTVWIGEVKQGLGIFQFTDDQLSIKSSVFPDSLQVSSVAPRNVAIVVSYSHHFLFVSRNYGKDWDQYTLPTMDFDPVDSLYLSELNPQHLVIHSRAGDLFISETLGEHWSHVASQVYMAEFGRTSQGEHLYYMVKTIDSNSNLLYRIELSSRTSTVIDHSTYRFRVDNRYLFISRKNTTENKKADQQSRRLYVSNNYDNLSGKVGFTEVQLPSLKDQQFYSVLATHETGAFIHVYDGTDSESGDLFVSDSTGSRFTKSLSNHLFSVQEYPLGHFSVHDFFEVKSMRGVYITTTVDKDVGGHITQITFDNGGLWQKLKAPDSSNCVLPECSLHLLLKYTQYHLPLYNYTSLKEPFSVESAPGIIIAHGSVGNSRDPTSPRVFVSSDGGHTWTDPGIPPGTYSYGIGDYGNIIAVAPDSENVPYMWFSHNRGKCFTKKLFDSTTKFTTRGVLLDPSAASLYGFVMGVEGLGSLDEWRINTVNFQSLLQRSCGDNDYSLITEHEGMGLCLLGYQSVYKITKDESICYNPSSYSYKAVKTNQCECDYTDLECDYGYSRSSQTTCSPIPNLSLSKACPPGATTIQQSTSGFRMIPGDQCIPTDEITKQVVTVSKTCTGHEQQSGIHPVTVNSMSTAGKIAGGFFIVVGAITAAGLTLFCWLKCRNRTYSPRDKVYYQRVPLSERESGRFSANDSSSDEDILT